MTTITDIALTTRARFFGGRLETRPVIVEPDGSILVYHDTAGHHTRWHSLTPRMEQRIRREAQAVAAGLRHADPYEQEG